MDPIDRKLLELLTADSRTPLKTLAGAVGLARSTVQDRIKRLEKAGVIKRYTIDVKPENAPEAYLWVKTDTKTCADIAPRIIAIPGVVQCRSIAGDQDMVVLVQAPALEELARLRAQIANIDGVCEITTHPVLKDWC